MSKFFIGPECLYQDLLAAPSEESWVRCQNLRAKYNSVLTATVVVLVCIILIYFIHVNIARNIVFGVGIGLVLVCGLYPLYVSRAASADYIGMIAEHENLKAKDHAYDTWKNFVEYKRSAQSVAASQQMAWGQLGILGKLNPISYV
jgi:hypothetical protein